MSFALAAAGDAELDVYSVDGRRVRRLARGRFEPGPHRVGWDGRDDRGQDVPSGVYFARLHGPQGAATRTMVRIRQSRGGESAAYSGDPLSLRAAIRWRTASCRRPRDSSSRPRLQWASAKSGSRRIACR